MKLLKLPKKMHLKNKIWHQPNYALPNEYNHLFIFQKKKKEKRNETHVRLTKYYSTNIIIINAIFVTLKKIGYGQQQAGKNLLN